MNNTLNKIYNVAGFDEAPSFSVNKKNPKVNVRVSGNYRIEGLTKNGIEAAVKAAFAAQGFTKVNVFIEAIYPEDAKATIEVVILKSAA